MMERNDKFPYNIGFGPVAAILWMILFTLQFVRNLPDLTPLEKAFLLMADVTYSFNSFGIGVIILLASGYLNKSAYIGIRFELLKWGKTICFAMLIVCLLIGILSFVNNAWSESLIFLIDANESGTIMLPLLPASKKLTEMLSPCEASLIQVGLASMNYFVYGAIFVCLKYLLRFTAGPIATVFCIHVIGKYALENWPLWIVFTPQSYFYIQNYNVWSPLPTPYSITALIRMILVLSFVICGAVLIGGRICRQNRKNAS